MKVELNSYLFENFTLVILNKSLKKLLNCYIIAWHKIDVSRLFSISIYARLW